ncbi:hypothetical protein AAVH_28295 [Aphelenchoides avenae]|nr:hypothetical protein AAVH_28295 [Aphelenchus avenae]
MALQLIVMRCVEYLFETHSRLFKRSEKKLVEALEQTLTRQLLLMRTLALLNECFKSTFSNVVKVIHTVVSMLKALADLYALVIAPAKMHSVIQEACDAMWSSEYLWLSRNKEVRTFAQTLLASWRQPNMGVSLGGITVVTRSLALTLASIIITFLTLFAEFRQTPFASDIGNLTTNASAT